MWEMCDVSWNSRENAGSQDFLACVCLGTYPTVYTPKEPGSQEQDGSGPLQGSAAREQLQNLRSGPARTSLRMIPFYTVGGTFT